MAGTYTHLTLVVHLCSAREIEKIGGLDRRLLAPLLSYGKYTELGAVSPDYPYLKILSSSANAWADAMHYERTGDRLRAGMDYVKGLLGEDKYKALAWLLGFTSHIITDISIHPVVELKVGPYAENAQEHRVCEMHQDVFIYRRMNVGDIFGGNFIHSGIADCVDSKDSGKLDPLIVATWSHMLLQTDAQLYAKNSPDFNSWHTYFSGLISAAGIGEFIPISRHFLSHKGVVYPKEPADDYISKLLTPGGASMDFAEVFDRAIDNVRSFWGLVCRYCLTDENPDLSGIRNWNLDTGQDENGIITMWEQ